MKMEFIFYIYFCTILNPEVGSGKITNVLQCFLFFTSQWISKNTISLTYANFLLTCLQVNYPIYYFKGTCVFANVFLKYNLSFLRVVMAAWWVLILFLNYLKTGFKSCKGVLWHSSHKIHTTLDHNASVWKYMTHSLFTALKTEIHLGTQIQCCSALADLREQDVSALLSMVYKKGS